MAIVHGTPRANILDGTPGNDIIYGYAGRDRLIGLDGDDLLYGGRGNDTFLLGGTGHNQVDGGSGSDTLRLDLSDRGADVSLTTTFYYSTGKLKYELSDGSFSVTASRVETYLIHAGAGDDNLVGGDGNDRLSGIDGDDSLGGGRGNDMLYGGRGNDYLEDHEGEDQLFGGAGHDSFYVTHEMQASPSQELVDGGNGHDTLNLMISGEDDVQGTFLSGGESGLSDGMTIRNVEVFSVSTGAGDDTLTMRAAALGRYRIDAGDGHDRATLDLSRLAGEANFSIRAGEWTVDGQQVSVVADGVEDLTIIGNGQANAFRATNDKVTLRGNGGNDLLEGGAGHDRLFGGTGRDTLRGSNGRDRLEGGAGNDWLAGGTGADKFVFSTRGGTDTVRDFKSGTDKIVFTGTGADFDDLAFAQRNGFVRVTLTTDTSDSPTVIKLLNTTLAEVTDAADYLFL